MMQQEQHRIILPSDSLSTTGQKSRKEYNESSSSSLPRKTSSSNHLGPSSGEMSSSTMAPNSLTNPLPSTSSTLVKQDEYIARVTLQAYHELDKLSQIAQVASAAASTSSLPSTSSSIPVSPPRHLKSPKTRSRNGIHNGVNGTSSLFIIKPKSKGKKGKPVKKMELENMLDRNHNLLKSREVVRLLSGPQLDKLKNDTAYLERQLEEIRERESNGSLEDTMMKLSVDSQGEVQLTDRYVLQIPRGKARLISVEDNVRLQRANFEAEQEMQRTKEYESMGKQMRKLDLSKTRGDMRHSDQGKQSGSSVERDDDDRLLLSRHYSESDIADLNDEYQ